MEIILAKNAGFCFGVRKAVDEVYRRIEESGGGAVYTCGEIVHNETVTGDLAAKGVRMIDDPRNLQQAQNADGRQDCIVIRAHGVGRDVYAAMEEKGFRVVDATCPFVKRIHETVRDAGEAGHIVVVIGNALHPEVQGITGWAQGDVYVVETPEEAEALSLPPDKEITIVCQTTFRRRKMKEIVEIFIKKEYNIHVADTICNATGVRQEEAAEIASGVDVMIVAGSAHSSNTRKLYEICREKCEHTYLVQNTGDLKGVRLDKSAKVGITAGASTPKKTIEEVLLYVRTGTGSVV